MSLPKHTSASPGVSWTLDEAIRNSAFTELELRELIKQGRLPVSHSERGVTLEKRDVERLSDLNTAK